MSKEWSHGYFSRDIAAPAALSDIVGHTANEIAYVRHSRVSVGQAHALVLDGGLAGSYTVQDLAATPHWIPLARGPLCPRTIQKRVEQLIMPARHWDARAKYIELLGIDDVSDIAYLLIDAYRHAPDVVRALLELRIRDAADLMKQVAYLSGSRELLRAMLGVRVAFWLRRVAMACAARLRRPFGWRPLDEGDPAGMGRYGPTHRLFTRQLELVERAFQLYRGVPFEIRSLNQSQASATCAAALLPPACLPAVDQFFELDLHLRAHVQLAIWRRKHGAELEKELEKEVRRIEVKLKEMREQLATQAPARRTENKRCGNLGSVEPLVLLFTAARFAYAWTREPRTADQKKKCKFAVCPQRRGGVKSAVSRLISGRASTGFQNLGLCCEETTIAQDIFMLLRFTVVEDPQMLSAELPEMADHRTGPSVWARSQDEAELLFGRRFTFRELWGAYEKSGRRTEITRKADLKAKSLGAFHPDMRIELVALLDQLTWDLLP